ncbi:GNAT family N-acetyltransferase [Actinomadura barringtoniae]|uniref:GNAT family N-acetyltransferase n=1 Tax=Actinomadura barringtoniae TaxID=1427535 RepID=A0A939P5Z3_9ACTN|nr:GNAT family N-acetyltransferase [Actinomadura barringtoniae]MBO2445865.1 GNAT family N-acetyltransferase [Actinomadura barringtoniae]
MNEIVTFVEMTDRDQLEPAAPVEGLVLERTEWDARVPEMLARVGTPYGWKSARRTATEWETWRAGSPRRMYWLLVFEGEPIGIITYEPYPDGDVEIRSFGLVPERVGTGLGSYALTLGVRQAWEVMPDVRRVWLHTSSLDHPNALPNYERRGFRVFKVEQRVRGS